MKFLNRFIIILSLLLIVSLGSVKAETLEDIAAELNPQAYLYAYLTTKDSINQFRETEKPNKRRAFLMLKLLSNLEVAFNINRRNSDFICFFF